MIERQLNVQPGELVLRSKDCDSEFRFSCGEREFFESKLWPEPSRCRDCRTCRRRFV